MVKKRYRVLETITTVDGTLYEKEVVTFERDLGNGRLAVKQTSDGGYIVAGGTSDAWLLKMDK